MEDFWHFKQLDFWLWRTLTTSDPFIDLSLTSISQLAAERHADGFQNLVGVLGSKWWRFWFKSSQMIGEFPIIHHYLLFHSAYYQINHDKCICCFSITEDSSKISNKKSFPFRQATRKFPPTENARNKPWIVSLDNFEIRMCTYHSSSCFVVTGIEGVVG